MKTGITSGSRLCSVSPAVARTVTHRGATFTNNYVCVLSNLKYSFKWSGLLYTTWIRFFLATNPLGTEVLETMITVIFRQKKIQVALV